MISIMRIDFFNFLEKIPSRKQRVPSGTILVNMDDEVSALYLVRTGMVHLVRFQESGNMVILQRAGTGSIVAESSVFSNRYHCSAVAVQESYVEIFAIEAVKALLDKKPGAAQAFALYLADQVRATRKRAEILALKTVSDRLSAWLTWNHGLLPERGAWHHVADEIGISKEALYRELSKRRKQEG